MLKRLSLAQALLSIWRFGADPLQLKSFECAKIIPQKHFKHHWNKQNERTSQFLPLEAQSLGSSSCRHKLLQALSICKGFRVEGVCLWGCQASALGKRIVESWCCGCRCQFSGYWGYAKLLKGVLFWLCRLQAVKQNKITTRQADSPIYPYITP